MWQAEAGRLPRTWPCETNSRFEREYTDMAKGQQRSNREKKKPKQEKVKPVATSSFTTPKANGGKK